MPKDVAIHLGFEPWNLKGNRSVFQKRYLVRMIAEGTPVSDVILPMVSLTGPFEDWVWTDTLFVVSDVLHTGFNQHVVDGKLILEHVYSSIDLASDIRLKSTGGFGIHREIKHTLLFNDASNFIVTKVDARRAMTSLGELESEFKKAIQHEALEAGNAALEIAELFSQSIFHPTAQSSP